MAISAGGWGRAETTNGRSMARRIAGGAGWGAAVALAVIPATARQTSRFLSLAQAKDIRQLRVENAAKARPVRLSGTVLALSGWKNSFFLHDASGVIRVDRTDEAEVHPGDAVELTGVTGAVEFAPEVVASRVNVLGRGRTPAPARPDYYAVGAESVERRGGETGGVVREAAISESWGRRVLFLTLNAGGGTVVARLHNFPERSFRGLVDANVRVRGVSGKILDGSGRRVGVRIYVPDFADVRVEKDATADPFAVPAMGLAGVYS